MRSPERKSTASNARLRMPVGARLEQAARSASTSASVRGSAGNRRLGVRFTLTKRSRNGFSVALKEFRHCIGVPTGSARGAQEKRHSATQMVRPARVASTRACASSELARTPAQCGGRRGAQVPTARRCDLRRPAPGACRSTQGSGGAPGCRTGGRRTSRETHRSACSAHTSSTASAPRAPTAWPRGLVHRRRGPMGVVVGGLLIALLSVAAPASGPRPPSAVHWMSVHGWQSSFGVLTPSAREPNASETCGVTAGFRLGAFSL
jgi:hypothetical protein